MGLRGASEKAKGEPTRFSRLSETPRRLAEAADGECFLFLPHTGPTLTDSVQDCVPGAAAFAPLCATLSPLGHRGARRRLRETRSARTVGALPPSPPPGSASVGANKKLKHVDKYGR